MELDKAAKKFYLDLHHAGLGLKGKASIAEQIQMAFRGNQELFELLGLVHPSLVFRDVVNHQYTFTTNTAWINSSVGQTDGSLASDFSTIPCMGSSWLASKLDCSPSVAATLFDLIYLPNRNTEGFDKPPEFIVEAEKDNGRSYQNSFRGDGPSVTRQCLEWMNEEFLQGGRLAVADFIRGEIKAINEALSKTYPFLVNKSEVREAIDILEKALSRYEQRNINSAKQVQLPESNATSDSIKIPVSPYTLLLVLLNESYIENGMLTIRQELEHRVYIVRRDYAQQAIANQGVHVLGSVVATYLPSNESDARFSELNQISMSIYQQYFDIFFDKVMVARIYQEQGRREALSQMTEISGHMMRNRIVMLRKEFYRTLDSSNISSDGYSLLEAPLESAADLALFFDSLRIWGHATKLDLLQNSKGLAIFAVGEVSLIYEDIIVPLVGRAYPKDEQGYVSLRAANRPIEDFTVFELSRARINPVSWSGGSKLRMSDHVLRCLFVETFINCAKHSPETNPASGSIEVWIDFINPPPAVGSDLGILISNSTGSVESSSTSFRQFSAGRTDSIAVLAEGLQRLGLGRVLYRIFEDSDHDKRYELLLIIEGLANDG